MYIIISERIPWSSTAMSKVQVSGIGEGPVEGAVGQAEIVSELRRKLNEKDSLLTETRLEALSSAHQVWKLTQFCPVLNLFSWRSVSQTGPS